MRVARLFLIPLFWKANNRHEFASSPLIRSESDRTISPVHPDMNPSRRIRAYSLFPVAQNSSPGGANRDNDSTPESSPESPASNPSARSPLTSFSSGSDRSVPRFRPIATVNISARRRNGLSPIRRVADPVVVDAGSQTGGSARRRNSQEGHSHHSHHCS